MTTASISRSLLVGALWLVIARDVRAQAAVEATGQAPIVNQDRARARSRALEEAMKRAVEQSAEQLLGAEEKRNKEATLRLRIYPRARIFIPSYRVLEEGDLAGSALPVFQVRILAQVAGAQIIQELTAVAPAASDNKPRRPNTVLACVKVQALSEPESQMLLAQSLAWTRELFASSAVEAVSGPCEVEVVRGLLARRAAGSAALLQLVATRIESVRGTSLATARVAATVQIIDGKQLIARSQAEGDAYADQWTGASAQALGRALETLAASLRRVVSDRSAEREAAGSAITLHVVNLRSYTDLQNITRALKVFPTVSRLELRRFAPGQADWVLQSTTASRALVERWQSMAARIPGSMSADADGGLTLRLQNEEGMAP